MTIVIISVTIMIEIAKTTIMIVDMWLQACAFDIGLPQHNHNHVKKHAKMAMNISDEIDLDKELKVFSVGGLKKKYVMFLPQMENA